MPRALQEKRERKALRGRRAPKVCKAKLAQKGPQALLVRLVRRVRRGLLVQTGL